MKKTLLILQTLLLFCTASTAQEAGLEKTVSINYENVLLGNALESISHDYNVFFSYSKDFIPVSDRVTANVYQQPLSKALDELLAPTKVVYAPIGDQIVLKINNNKPVLKKQEEELTGSLDHVPVFLPEQIYSAKAPATKPLPKRDPIKPTPLLRTPDLQPMDWTDDMLVLDEESLVVIPYEAEDKFSFHRIAQVSVLPELGTNLGQSKDMINNVSVNVLWGKNGGVEGMEVGGLINNIEGDVKGVQLAGIANRVKGELGATSSKENGKDPKAGLQIAGLSNMAASARGAQISGGVNRIYKGDLQGTQIAGLANQVSGNANGVQIAGLFNSNGGNAGFQVAGLMNNADEVSKGQIAGVINLARKVNGIQIGLINVADSINGTPIGLLNFIKYGFNRLEIGKSETFKAIVGIKFGAPSFYNMLEISSPNFKGERSVFHQDPYWAIGYGIGTSIHHKRRWNYQLEAMVHQVNEGEFWTDQLNLLSQLRLLINLRIGKHFSIYGGPSINIFISKLYNQETLLFESTIFRDKSVLEETWNETDPHRIQAWIGYKAGIRF